MVINTVGGSISVVPGCCWVNSVRTVPPDPAPLPLPLRPAGWLPWLARRQFLANP
jgi:hypothetical protein